MADFLSNEARTNEDFSLEVVHTTLSVEQEQDLRSVRAAPAEHFYSAFHSNLTPLLLLLLLLRPPSLHVQVLVTTLLRGSVYSGSGNLISLDGPTSLGGGGAMLCYYCVVRDEGQPPSPDAAPDAATATADDSSYFSSDHVICLLREFASQDVRRHCRSFVGKPSWLEV